MNPTVGKRLYALRPHHDAAALMPTLKTLHPAPDFYRLPIPHQPFQPPLYRLNLTLLLSENHCTQGYCDYLESAHRRPPHYRRHLC